MADWQTLLNGAFQVSPGGITHLDLRCIRCGGQREMGRSLCDQCCSADRMGHIRGSQRDVCLTCGAPFPIEDPK